MILPSSKLIQRQRKVTRLCIEVAQRLLQHGMESAIIMHMVYCFGIALGINRIECALAPTILFSPPYIKIITSLAYIKAKIKALIYKLWLKYSVFAIMVERNIDAIQ